MRIREYYTAGIIILGGLLVVWLFMIRPHTHEWTPTGEASGQVKTLLSNSNVIGSPVIKAVVTLESGGQTIISVPIKSNVRAGDRVVLNEMTDQNNSNRKRYYYARLP